MLHDVADELSKQARELFGHLPEGTITEDEPVHFKTDTEGNVMVKTATALYVLRDSAAWRFQDGALYCWRNRELIAFSKIGPSALGMTVPKWS